MFNKLNKIMGKVLIIKRADFSANCIETITPVPEMDWETYDFQPITENGYLLDSQMKWASESHTTAYWIPVVSGRRYRIILGDNTSSGFGWFTQIETPVVGNAPVNIIGNGEVLYANGNPNEVTAPSGANYMFVNKSYSNIIILEEIKQYVTIN